MNYAYLRVEEIADDLREKHPAFADHLVLVAKALHDIEWVEDGDMAEGAEQDAIAAVLGGPA